HLRHPAGIVASAPARRARPQGAARRRAGGAAQGAGEAAPEALPQLRRVRCRPGRGGGPRARRGRLAGAARPGGGGGGAWGAAGRVRRRGAGAGPPLAMHWLPPTPAPEPFHLRTASAGLRAGDEQAVTIFVQRDNRFREPITLTFSGLPDEVTVTPGEVVVPAGVPGEEDRASVTVRAGPNVPPGSYTLTVHPHAPPPPPAT